MLSTSGLKDLQTLFLLPSHVIKLDLAALLFLLRSCPVLLLSKYFVLNTFFPSSHFHYSCSPHTPVFPLPLPASLSFPMLSFHQVLKVIVLPPPRPFQSLLYFSPVSSVIFSAIILRWIDNAQRSNFWCSDALLKEKNKHTNLSNSGSQKEGEEISFR